MSTLSNPSTGPHIVKDTLTMTSRNLRHNLRMPSGIIVVIALPLIFLLLFVYVFGGTLGAGLTVGGTRQEYLSFITPAILLMAATSATQMIAVWISSDMKEGIVARFRTMPIAPSSVLAGHVYGGILLVIFTTATLLGVTLLLGYQPLATPQHWFALAGFLLLIAIALAWFTVALGLAAQGPETASNSTMLLMILPLLSNGFVPTDTLPVGLRWFADHQPFTPIITTIRSLLSGNPDIDAIIWAISWCTLVSVIGYAWSMRLYKSRAARR